MAASKRAKPKTKKRDLPLLEAWDTSKLRVNRWLKMPRRLYVFIGVATVLIGLAAISSEIVLQVEADSRPVASAPFVKSMYNVADILTARPKSTLVANKGMLKVLGSTLGSNRQTFELNTCPSVNDAVTKQLAKQSIVVLVNIDNAPGKHQCTLGQIVQAYGRPNASTTLTGTLTNPQEVLLYYDAGPQLSAPIKPISPPQAPATVIPMTLATLPATTCASKTVLSVVAHEDDDILFMNPDHEHDIRGGECLRTVFLTAGDDGLSQSYWLAREKGAEAAYDTMVGHGASLWIERNIEVNKHEYIKMANPRGNANITLIFVNLPDGNVPGTGFLRTHYESLAKLESGAIGSVATVDKQSTYSKSDLTSLLTQLMQYYHPGEVDTQTPIDDSLSAVEHSDHMTTGQFTAAAYAQYGQGIPLRYYTGYPIALLPQNVAGQDLIDKTATFYSYVPHDIQVCLNPADCASTGPYATWLMREYTYSPGDPLIPAPTSPASTTPPTSTPTTSTDSGSSDPTSSGSGSDTIVPPTE